MTENDITRAFAGGAGDEITATMLGAVLAVLPIPEGDRLIDDAQRLARGESISPRVADDLTPLFIVEACAQLLAQFAEPKRSEIIRHARASAADKPSLLEREFVAMGDASAHAARLMNQ